MARIQDLYSTGSTGLARSLVGFAVAPLLSCLVVVSGVVGWLVWTAWVNDPEASFLVVMGAFLGWVLIGTATVGGLFTYLGMLLVGFPTWVILRFTHNESGLAYTLAGALGGWWLGPALGGHKWEGFPMDLAGAIGGGLALFLFWRIARRR